MSATLMMIFNEKVRWVFMQEADLNYQAVVDKICDAFPELHHFVAKYLDDEGSRCTLCEASFSDFISVSRSLVSSSATNPTFQVEVYPLSPDKSSYREVEARAAPTATETSESDFTRRHPEKVVPLLSKLLEQNMTSVSAAAGLLAHALPSFIEQVTEHAADVGRHLQTLPRSFLEDLLSLSHSTGGLDSAVEELVVLMSFIESNELNDGSLDRTAGEAVLSLLQALDTAAVDVRRAFLESLVRLTQEKDIFAMMPAFTTSLADVKLSHDFVHCDGCHRHHIQGLRFKCRICKDYDLCGNCYARRPSLQEESCANHDFDCIPIEWSMWHPSRPFDLRNRLWGSFCGSHSSKPLPSSLEKSEDGSISEVPKQSEMPPAETKLADDLSPRASSKSHHSSGGAGEVSVVETKEFSTDDHEHTLGRSGSHRTETESQQQVSHESCTVAIGEAQVVPSQDDDGYDEGWLIVGSTGK
jgi:hypothetical protein